MDHKSTILIADDEASILDIYKSLFSEEEYNLIFADNGSVALEKAKEITPDLILLDVMMPGMDGFEVCRHLRTDPHLAEVPVIMVTTMFDRKTRLTGLKAGADDFITKPFDIEDLESRVKTITRLNRYRKILVERSKTGTLIELSPEGVVIVDAGGKVTLANSAAKKMLGVEDERDIVGKKMKDLVIPERAKTCVGFLDDVAKGSSHQRIETSLLRPDGGLLPVEIIAASIEWDGKPSVYVMMRDITERRRAEEALRESEEKYRILVENANDGITIVQDNLNIFVNRRIEEMVGYKVEELVGRDFMSFVDPEATPRVADTHDKHMSGEKSSTMAETTLIHKDGHKVYVEFNARNFTYNEKPAVLVITRDITDRKQMEEALRENEYRFRTLIEQSSDAIAIFGDDGAIKYVSQSNERVQGDKPEDLIGTRFVDLIHPDDVDELDKKFKDLLSKKMDFVTSTYRCRHRDGSWRILETVSRDFINDPRIKGIVTNYRDITERVQAEETLRENEERYRLLVENLNDVVFTLNLKGNMTYVSPIIEKLSGYKPEKFLDQSYVKFVHPDDLPGLMDSFEHTMAGKTEVHEFRFKVKGNKYRHVFSSERAVFEDGQPVGFVGSALSAL
jgi:PAS domain S-box-containing protein